MIPSPIHLVDRALVVMDRLHHRPRTGSRSFRAFSGSRSASNSIEPFRSANSTVICLRSPSSAALEVRICSARCFGGVGLGRSETRLRRGGDLLAEPGSAAVAESTSRRIEVITGRARELKACAAAVAEACASGIVLLEVRPTHQPSPLISASAAPGRTACPSRGTSSWWSRSAPAPARACPYAGRACRGRGSSAR
jgi:hypothetical protein